jgi:hypothetical protein
MKSLIALVLVVALAACGGVGRTLSGNWSGTVNVSGAGPGTATMSISQSGDGFVGTWQIAFAEGESSGSLEGVVIGDSTVTMQLYPSSPSACPYQIAATWSANTLSGSYETFNCSGRVSGRLDLQKR